MSEDSLFRRVSRIVNSDLSLDEMLGQVVGLTAQVSGCDACLVYLLESSGDFVLRASQVPRDEIGAVTVKPGEGVTGWVAEHRAPVALGSRAFADPRFKNFSTLVEDTYEALLSVPLVHKSRSIGVINVHHREAHQHASDEVAAISFIGEQMGGALAKIMLEAENLRLAARELKQEQDRLRLEDEVARRTAQIQEMTRLKSEFLANVSHELRTPLNGILGMATLLLETELDAEQRDFAGMIKLSGDALFAQISNLLDFAQIDSGKIRLSVEEMDLDALLQAALEPFLDLAEAKGLTLTYTVAPGTPTLIRGDARCLGQVLKQLLDNAVKFTEQGSIRVQVQASAAGLQFTVSDTGIGIAEPRGIFDAFVQVDGSSTRPRGGTGLGLAICSELVHLMGGGIWVESEPGKGSAFYFTSPVS